MIRINVEEILISILFLIVLFMVLYLRTYVNPLAYYEENQANTYCNYIFIPIILLMVCLFAFRENKRGMRKGIYVSERHAILKQLPKKTVIFLVVAIIIFQAFLKPIFSGCLIYVNKNFGQKNEIHINGIIVNRHIFRHTKGPSEYELTVKNENGEVYIFDTHKNEIEQYNIRDKFEKQMWKGCLGLLYIE